MRTLRIVTHSVIELLFPSHARCMGCGDLAGTDRGWLCERCTKKMRMLSMARRNICPRCGSALPLDGICTNCSHWPEDGVRVLRYCYGYAHPLSNAVRNMKYHGAYEMANWMGREMAKLLEGKTFGRIDALVPVPMHPARQRERGKNHALCLAQALSKETGVPVRDILMRTKKTKQQAKLSGKERREALHGAFALQKNAGNLHGLRVLLVDDVVTTGTTLNECAKSLYEGGAECVSAATFLGYMSAYQRKIRNEK